MTTDLAPGCILDLDRGPDWLFARLQIPSAADLSLLAESLWSLLQEQLLHRLILELDEVHYLRSELIGELVKLHKRITANGGLLRLCGLSDENQEVLRHSRLHDRFPQYRDRHEAVMGFRPALPR